MNVAFINENTLGHASYLLPFVNVLERGGGLGVIPHLINATPLPERLRTRADFTVPGLRRWGLDFHNARWRLTVSRHVRQQLRELRARQPIDAVVVNTQSVALDLAGIAADLPIFVCLDATFAQLSRSRWFAPNVPSRIFLPLTSAPIRRRERVIFQAARRLLPWSQVVEHSLREDYGIRPELIARLPPSIALPPRRRKTRPANTRPQLLFVGGDFQRKGGPLLLECFQRHFAGRCELHVVTESKVEAEDGVFVHRDVKAHSDAWRQRWEQADVFVFPSTLETFGIVLLEALAFEVPVVSAEVGAAREILAEGKAGWLLHHVTTDTLAACLNDVFAAPAAATSRASRGRLLIETEYDLMLNARRLADFLHAGRRRAEK